MNDTTLHILHDAYSNSLEENDILYKEIPSLKINLRRHQHAVIDKMNTNEKEFLNGYKLGNRTIYCKYGILGDSVGVGKTFMVLGHIALNSSKTIHKFPTTNPYNNRVLYSMETTEYQDIVNVGSLIIVPHTLFRQWADEITQKTTLKVALLKTRKHVYTETFLKTVQDADVTLVSNTLFKDLYSRSFELNLFWNRIYIDEADSIEITSVIVKSALPTNFVWLITASFTNLLFPYPYSIYINMDSYNRFKEIYNVHAELTTYLEQNTRQYSNTYYLHTFLRSNRFITEMINSNHPLRGHCLIRCSQNFIHSSIELPPLFSRTILCKPSISHRLVHDVISPSIRGLLNAGDIKSALDQLGVKTENNTSLIHAVNDSKEKELERLQKTYEFKQSIEYSSPQVKEASLKNLLEKINHIKDQIQSLKERLENYKEDICPICYDEAKDAVVTNCCSRIFCAYCILQSLARNTTCPICRSTMSPSSLKKLTTENIIVENKVDQKKKIDTFFEIIENNKDGKFLVFSRYDNSFLEIIEGYEKRNIIAKTKTLKGSKDMIASTLNSFKEGAINCLLMNTIQMGAGLNITEATHVILLHSMTHEEEKQILGRAYRVGRTKELHFIKLLHPDEV